MVSGAPFVEHHVLATKLSLQRRGLHGVDVDGLGPASSDYWQDLTPAEQLGILFDHLADLYIVADKLRRTP